MPKDIASPSPCAGFIVANCAVLCCAADLLGGQTALKRVLRLIEDFSLAPVLTRRLNRELDALEDLLALRNVHDVGRIEAAQFDRINLLDPAVEEICQLLEGLRAARQTEAEEG